jgi:hypothetical protein
MNTIPILAMGGCCGDLVSAVIDPTLCFVIGDRVKLDNSRSLKSRAYKLISDTERINLLQESKFLSLACHWTELILAHSIPYISVAADTFADAQWASARFHRFMKASGANVTATNTASDIMIYTDYIRSGKHAIIHLTVNEIRQGMLIDRLKTVIATPLSTQIYNDWLNAQK